MNSFCLVRQSWVVWLLIPQNVQGTREFDGPPCVRPLLSLLLLMLLRSKLAIILQCDIRMPIASVKDLRFLIQHTINKARKIRIQASNYGFVVSCVLAYTIYNIHTVRTLNIIMFTSILFVRSISFASIMFYRMS